jgi:hypothetical protein
MRTGDGGRRGYEDMQHHDKILETKRRWRANNRERLREYERLYRAENRERINAVRRAWKARTGGKSAKAYYQKHREEICARQAQHRKEFREEILRKKRVEYHRKARAMKIEMDRARHMIWMPSNY